MKSSKRNEAAALAEKAAASTAAAELDRQKALEAGAEFDAEAQERRQKFMTKWLDEEFVDAPAAGAAQRATLAAFETAVQNDPLMQVWLEHLRASYRIGADGQTAANFAQQTGVPAPQYFPNAGTPTFFEVMNLAMQHLASRLEG